MHGESGSIAHVTSRDKSHVQGSGTKPLKLMTFIIIIIIIIIIKEYFLSAVQLKKTSRALYRS